VSTIRSPSYLVLAAAALLGACRGPAQKGPKPDPGGAREISFVTGRATGGSVTVAPDGSFIIFSLLGDLYRVAGSGGDAVNLTSGPAWDAFPRLSPDGRLLAYVSDRQFWRDDVYVRELATGRELRVTRDGSGAMNPAFSPDGKSVAYVRQSGFSFQVRAVDLETLEDRAISAPGTISIDPFPMPRGWGYSEVRFSRTEPPSTRLLYVRPESGRDPEVLLDVPGTVFRTVAEPDGRRLVFRHQLFKEQTVEVLDRSRDSVPRSLAPPEISGGFFFATLSQSGAPAIRGGEAFFFREGRLVAAPLAGGPSSREIAFRAAVEWTIPGRSARPVRVPPEGVIEDLAVMSPRLSPDGRRIAFGALGDAFVQDVGDPGRPAVRLTRTAGRSETPIGFLPDGSSLLVRLRGDGIEGPLLLLPLVAGGRAGVFGKPGDEIEDVTIAPSGDHAVGASGDEIVRIDLESGAIWPLGRTGSDWSPRPAEDALGSVTFLGRTSGVANVWRLGTESSEIATHLTRHAFSHSVSADGRWLVIERDLAAYRLRNEPGADESGLERISDAFARSVAVAPDGLTVTFADGMTVHLVDVETLAERRVAIRLPAAVEPAPPPILVRGATLWDGTGAAPVPDASIRVENGRISWIGRSDREGGRAAGAEIVDARGLFAVPGFVEMHSHTHGTDPRAFLAYGITSVRDTGGDAAWLANWRARSETGDREGPRLFLMGEILEGGQPYWVDGFFQVERPEEAEAAVAELAARGACAIKVYPSLTRSARRAAAAAAGARGLRTIGHGVTIREVAESVADGLHGLEHSPDGFVAEDVIRLLRSAEIDVTPTLCVMGLGNLILREEPRRLADPLFRRAVPDWHVLESRAASPYASDSLESLRDVARTLYGYVRSLSSAGVRIAAGTDAPNPCCFHGPSLHWEMRFFVLAGLSEAAALAAATRDAARSIGADGEIGTIEVGKRADLVLLERDPLADIRNTERIAAVVRGGRVHRPREIFPEAFGGEPERFDLAARRVEDWLAASDPGSGRERGGPPLPDLSSSGRKRSASDREERTEILATFDAARLDSSRAARLESLRARLAESRALEAAGPLAVLERALSPFERGAGPVDAARLARVLAAVPGFLDQAGEDGQATTPPEDARRIDALIGRLSAVYEEFPGVDAFASTARARISAGLEPGGATGSLRPGGR